MCEHAPLLDKSYPGCFCIYCGANVAKIEADEYGQIFLEPTERGAERRYVAVIHKDQQRAVESVNMEQGRVRIRFKGDADSTQTDSTRLLSAFQDDKDEKEVMRI
jgi:hypothetical protein